MWCFSFCSSWFGGKFASQARTAGLGSSPCLLRHAAYFGHYPVNSNCCASRPSPIILWSLDLFRPNPRRSDRASLGGIDVSYQTPGLITVLLGMVGTARGSSQHLGREYPRDKQGSHGLTSSSVVVLVSPPPNDTRNNYCSSIRRGLSCTCIAKCSTVIYYKTTATPLGRGFFKLLKELVLVLCPNTRSFSDPTRAAKSTPTRPVLAPNITRYRASPPPRRPTPRSL